MKKPWTLSLIAAILCGIGALMFFDSGEFENGLFASAICFISLGMHYFKYVRRDDSEQSKDSRKREDAPKK
jgi:hypothetical protein